MSLPHVLQSLHERYRIARWIGGTRNLALLRRRMHTELPRPYLKGFYRTWVWGHARRRLQLKGLPSGVPAPLTIKISPTMRCNLACRGCFAAEHPSRDRLSLSVMERVIRQANEVGVGTIGVIGGEPLLHPDVFELLAEFPAVGFYLVTNGTLVDDAVVDRLAGLPHVVPILSLEGFEHTNDSLRGEGVYAKVLGAMEKLHSARLIFGFSTTVHRENRAEVVSADFIDTMIDAGCYFGGFIPYIPVGASPRYEVVCTSDEVAAYYAHLDALVRSRPLAVLKEGYGDGSFFNQGCRAGSTIHITATGEAEPCNGIEFFTHNVHDASLAEVLDSPLFQAVRDLHGDGPRRCLVDTEPERVLAAVAASGARATHTSALQHLEEWSARLARREATR